MKMSVENLVKLMDDVLEDIVIIDEYRKEEIYRGPAKGAVELGFGNYRIRWMDGNTWYW